MVPEPSREVPQAGEARPAEIQLAERHRRGQRRFQPRGGQREGGGPFTEKSGDAAGQFQQRPLVERGETDREPESGEALQRHLRGGHIAEHARKQRRRWDMGIVQPQAFLSATTVLARSPAAEDREPLLIVLTIGDGPTIASDVGRF